VNYNQNLSEYDSNNNRISFINQIWQNTAWVNSTKSLSEYDEYDNLSYSLFQNWDDNAMDWANLLQTFYYYQIITNTIDFDPAAFNFQVSPNPGNGQFKLEVENTTLQDGTLNIYNPIGQLLYTQSIANRDGRETINISHLPIGTYFLQLKSKEQHVTKAIQIMR
jgi:hypothetical protein